MESMSDKNRKLIKALELIGDYELMKPVDEIDGDLIDATVNWSLRLQNKDITLSTEEIEKMVSMIPFDDTEELETNGEVHKSKKVLKKNKVLFIAAIIAILVTLLTIVSVAFEWNIFEELKNRFGSVADTPVNEEIVVDGISVFMIGEFEKHENIEDVVISKYKSVLHPSVLPEGITLEKLTYFNDMDEKRLSFVFNDNNLMLQVIFDEKIEYKIKNIPTKELIINDFVCYECNLDDMKITQIYFEHKNNSYMISYNNRQELIEIIQNLKELD